MKHFQLILPFIVFALPFFFSKPSFAQYYTSNHFTRGADTAEFYFSCQWYADINYITWNGIFHTSDNGKTISVQRKTNWLVEDGNIYGDSMSGALFQIPYHSQDTFAVSYDYGITFQPKYFPMVPYSVAGGMAGELYTSSYGLYRGIDYGNTFTLQSSNDSLILMEVGTLPGEVYSYKFPYLGGPLGLAYSNDYGQTFTVSYINFPGIPDFHECNLHRGTEPGELYFVIWKDLNNVALFHSFDYGQTLEFKSNILFHMAEMWRTAGRTPGSFYYIQREICGTQPSFHSCLYIYFSNDYGETFTTYYHDLDSTYTGITESPKWIDNIQVFPNPAYEKFTVKFQSNTHGVEIELFNIYGQRCIKIIHPPNKELAEIDVGNPPPGIYFLKVLAGTKVIGVEKVVVE